MPSFQSVGLQQSTTKVLSLWNGSSNNAPPGGWFSAGFDDSSWSSSVTPTTPSGPPTGRITPSYVAYTATNSTLPSDTQPIAPWSTPPALTAAFLVRGYFTAPSLAWSYYLTETFQSNVFGQTFAGNQTFGFQGVWINGNSVTDWTQIGQYLNPGGTNLIATGMFPPAGGQLWGDLTAGWTTARFTFWQSDAGGQANAWGTITPGLNDMGVLGTGDVATHLVPTQCSPALPTNIVKIVSNGKTTLFLTADQTVWGCGDRSTALLPGGILGVNATPIQILPNASTGDLRGRITDIDIGNDCAMALSREAIVYGWGANAHGSLGTSGSASSPTAINSRVGYQAIACGSNFAVKQRAFDQFGLDSFGGNEAGQLALGTSGADSSGNAQLFDGSSTSPVSPAPFIFACGDAQFAVLLGSLGNFYAAGDGSSGALGHINYPNTINTYLTFQNAASRTGTGNDLQVSGPMSYWRDPTGALSGVAGGILVMGDGRPYGGAGDGNGNILYGASTLNLEGVVVQDTHSTSFACLALAHARSSHNPWVAGNSQAMMAAIGLDNKLYTWGYGGYGQMGNSGLVNTNTIAKSTNGLTNVIAAAVANQIAFAVGDGGIPIAPSAGRSFVTMLGF